MNQIKIPFFNDAVQVSYTDKGVTEISFIKNSKKIIQPLSSNEKKIEKQVSRFLKGQTQAIDLPIDWDNLHGTEFQKKVWKKMIKIPFGKVVSYGELARSVNSPRGARAVGTACAKNPVLLIIPCHRIVGGKSLGGFSGGGLKVKKQLLNLEGAQYE